jgi:hypothetical protein
MSNVKKKLYYMINYEAKLEKWQENTRMKQK